jgi:hypothetical protein
MGGEEFFSTEQLLKRDIEVLSLRDRAKQELQCPSQTRGHWDAISRDEPSQELNSPACLYKLISVDSAKYRYMDRLCKGNTEITALC